MGMSEMDEQNNVKKKGNRLQKIQVSAAGSDQSQDHAEGCPVSIVDGMPHLIASASSPSLLDGCGDPTTPTGANIERHILSHHINSNIPPLSPRIEEEHVQTHVPIPPLVVSPTTACPPDSVFLTPAPTRQRRCTPERPSSAPPHHLERIAGTLLRLVGDNYMCCTCGRELRSIGDQLTLETNLRHALSSGDLERLQNL